MLKATYMFLTSPLTICEHWSLLVNLLVDRGLLNQHKFMWTKRTPTITNTTITSICPQCQYFPYFLCISSCVTRNLMCPAVTSNWVMLDSIYAHITMVINGRQTGEVLNQVLMIQNVTGLLFPWECGKGFWCCYPNSFLMQANWL